MSFDFLNFSVGLLCLALAAYLGLAAAVLVYRRAWALRQASPILAYGMQTVAGLCCAGLVALGLILVRLHLGFSVPAGADDASVFEPYLSDLLALLGICLGLVALFELSCRKRFASGSLQPVPPHQSLPPHEATVLGACPHCGAEVAYERWLVVDGEPGLMGCPECHQSCAVDAVFPPVVKGR